MKLWDIRDPSNCKVTFDGKSEAVRDVKFSKHYTNFFAAAFDNGTVQVRLFHENFCQIFAYYPKSSQKVMICYNVYQFLRSKSVVHMHSYKI